jgi:hypothetical protein
MPWVEYLYIYTIREWVMYSKSTNTARDETANLQRGVYSRFKQPVLLYWRPCSFFFSEF